MCQHKGVGVLALQLHEFLQRELLVHMAGAIPQQHLPSGHRIYIISEIPVRSEYYFLVGGKRLHYFAGVRRCHHHIGERFHRRRCVDVAYHRVPRMSLDESLELIGRTRVGQRASGIDVGHQHRLVGAENLRRLPHEVNAAEHYHPVGKRAGNLRQGQGVADKIGHILDFPFLVIMGQDHGVAFLFQTEHLGAQRVFNIHFFIFSIFSKKEKNSSFLKNPPQ